MTRSSFFSSYFFSNSFRNYALVETDVSVFDFLLTTDLETLAALFNVLSAFGTPSLLKALESYEGVVIDLFSYRSLLLFSFKSAFTG